MYWNHEKRLMWPVASGNSTHTQRFRKPPSPRLCSLQEEDLDYLSTTPQRAASHSAPTSESTMLSLSPQPALIFLYKTQIPMLAKQMGPGCLLACLCLMQCMYLSVVRAGVNTCLASPWAQRPGLQSGSRANHSPSHSRCPA